VSENEDSCPRPVFSSRFLISGAAHEGGTAPAAAGWRPVRQVALDPFKWGTTFCSKDYNVHDLKVGELDPCAMSFM
jgi:hypothetical protein